MTKSSLGQPCCNDWGKTIFPFMQLSGTWEILISLHAINWISHLNYHDTKRQISLCVIVIPQNTLRPVNLFLISTLGMKSRASVTVMVTCVWTKESSNIQSGWKEGKVNLREAVNTKVMSHRCDFTVAKTETLLSRVLKLVALHSRGSSYLPEEMEHRGKKQLVVDGNAHVARLVEGWGDRPDCGPQRATPAQEEKFR